jgi:DDE superfamily endonuclease
MLSGTHKHAGPCLYRRNPAYQPLKNAGNRSFRGTKVSELSDSFLMLGINFASHATMSGPARHHRRTRRECTKILNLKLPRCNALTKYARTTIWTSALYLIVGRNKMHETNPLTGLKRRGARRETSRKKRESTCSTVSGRMYAEQAMELVNMYMAAANLTLSFVMLLMRGEKYQSKEEPTIQLVSTLIVAVVSYGQSAVRLLKLDSDLMDLPAHLQESAGFDNPLVDITLDRYQNDDECAAKTRFTKDQIRTIIEKLDLEEYVHVYYNFNAPRPPYYKFHRETLVLYMLRKMASARTHVDLADNEFGGDSKRWGTGYNYIVNRFDGRFCDLIGPRGLRVWSPFFPEFAEVIRAYICRSKERTNRQGDRVQRQLHTGWIPPGQFNIFGFTDCSFYEVCRPGSGPANNTDGAPRRTGWYIKQRAFYCGYQRGMEACIKVLTIFLPNGLTAAIYGPTSGKQEDKTLFRLAEFDDYLHDLCIEQHNGRLFCTYGDGIFGGYWYCLRSPHVPPPDMPLTEAQVDQNENMKSARQSIEMSYAEVEQKWPLINRKDDKRIDFDPACSFAEIRVMYLLTNFSTCCKEGGTMTGQRGFRMPPPTLEDYLNMIV